MALFLQILLLVVLILILIKSADLIEDSLVVISKKLHISTFISGFVILSIASTLPELSVVISASSQNAPDLSVGNLLGATVFLLTVVISIFAIKHKSIPFGGSFSTNELLITLGLIATHTLALVDGKLSLIEGILMILSYAALVIYLTWRSNKMHHTTKLELKITNNDAFKAFVKSVVGIAFLIISSNLLVRILIDVSNTVGISDTLVGLLALGIGTTIPEITIALASNNLEKEKLSTGNLIGSAVTNVFALGLLTVLSPHKIDDFSVLVPVIIALITACLFFAIFAIRNRDLTRKEGIFLLLIFAVLTIYQLVRLSIFLF